MCGFCSCVFFSGTWIRLVGHVLQILPSQLTMKSLIWGIFSIFFPVKLNQSKGSNLMLECSKLEEDTDYQIRQDVFFRIIFWKGCAEQSYAVIFAAWMTIFSHRNDRQMNNRVRVEHQSVFVYAT